ncbi:MAG TPA: M20/M25/M40 family metallo-hydrolase [Steroidobacteraceae bacterium]|nr:M20/M25/M40 family metallo-hydrolase [Steroidobacteraceae bacterium]
MSKLLLPACAVLFVAAAVAAVPDKSTSAWWGHITVLASSDFQGRLTGSPGYHKAAEYVAAGFEREGLKPAGTSGYFQNVRFEVQTIETDRVRVRLTRAKGAAPLDVNESVEISPGVPQRTDTRAPLVFAGYGIHLPEAGYDDFAGLDVRGAVVVFLTGGPQTLSGPQRAHAVSEALPRFLEESGAVGVLSLIAPKNREVPWERQKAAGTQPGMALSEKALRRYQGPMFSASFDEAKAEELFAGSGHRFSELVALAEAHQRLPHFRLAAGIDAHVEAQLSSVSAENVVAELPGSDASLAEQAVVLSAHLDHLGTGKPDHGDGIFHGAMDDASGVASLLEIAHRLNASKSKPRRSILLVAVCGEEKGLLGSRYFAAHPTRHAGHIVADINTDMFLPLYPLQHVVVFGGDESSLGDDVRAVATRLGVDILPDPLADHLVFVRSDQYNFVRKGTPSVMLLIYPAPGSAGVATFNEWFSTRYHAQADDLSQPVDLTAAETYNTIVYRLAMRVADAPNPPAWRRDSFFARFADHPLP